MSQLIHASTSESPAAGNLLPQDAVVVSGTCLLEEFFQIVAAQRYGQLAICTPFIDEAFRETSSGWAAMRHSEIDIRVVTKGQKDAMNAWSALRVFHWNSAEIWQCRNLHAKIYSFVSPECGVALVGSHNLTRHGLAVNIEAGVLFKGFGRDHDVANTASACHEQVNRLVRHSKILIDTKCWPRPDELDGKERIHE